MRLRNASTLVSGHPRKTNTIGMGPYLVRSRILAEPNIPVNTKDLREAVSQDSFPDRRSRTRSFAGNSGTVVSISEIFSDRLSTKVSQSFLAARYSASCTAETVSVDYEHYVGYQDIKVLLSHCLSLFSAKSSRKSLVFGCRASSRYGTFPGSLILGFLIKTSFPGPRPVVTPSFHNSLALVVPASLVGSFSPSISSSSSLYSVSVSLRDFFAPFFPPVRLAGFLFWVLRLTPASEAEDSDSPMSEGTAPRELGSAESESGAEPGSKYLLCLAVDLTDLELEEVSFSFLSAALESLDEARLLGELLETVGAVRSGTAREDRRGMAV